jgi:hypothetical protein
MIFSYQKPQPPWQLGVLVLSSQASVLLSLILMPQPM